MNIKQLQSQLGSEQTGVWDLLSRAALVAHLRNPFANRLNERDFAAAAARLGCSVSQIKAVRAVEAAGTGFTKDGDPIILFERHKFHRFTGGRFSPAPFSMAERGGYSVNSWVKLQDAIATGEVDAAFMSCSWGAFQVMGQYWSDLGYPSPWALAWSCAQSEGDQLELMVRYIEHFKLEDELRQLSKRAADCAPFAAAYNGPSYKANHYDEKLAAAIPH